MTTVLHLPNGGRHVVPPKRDTIATGAPADGASPLISLSLDELSVVARFLDVAMTDLHAQAALMAREPGMTPRKLKEMKQPFVAVSAWIAGVQQAIAKMAAEAEVPTEEPAA